MLSHPSPTTCHPVIGQMVLKVSRSWTQASWVKTRNPLGYIGLPGININYYIKNSGLIQFFSISFAFQITQESLGQGLGNTALRRSSQYSRQPCLLRHKWESSKIIKEGGEVRIWIRLCPGCGLPGHYTAGCLINNENGHNCPQTVMLNALMEFIFTSELHVNHENECCCCQPQTC